MRRTVLLVAFVSLLGGCSATVPTATVVETAPPPLVTQAESEPPTPPPSAPITVLVVGNEAEPEGVDALVAALEHLPDVTVTFDDLATEPPDVAVVGISTRLTLGPDAVTSTYRQLPTIVVSVGGDSSSDFAAAARLAAEEVDEHRADFGSAVVNLNIPSCAPGTMVRGVVEVPVAPESPADSGAPAFDCGSTMIEYQDDVSALAVGFASRTVVRA